jgi:ankyrin repeat protein
MSSCYDQDGYNALERAIQGGSPELVQYLIDIGVESDIDKGELIEMALSGLKYRRKDKYITVIGISDSKVLKLSYLEHENILQQLAPNKVSTNHIRDLSVMLLSFNSKMKMEDLYGLLSMKRTMFDELVSNLLIAYRYEVEKNEICQASTRKFSIIHRLAFDGLQNSIQHAVVYWGQDILNCKNTDDFTPLYLSKVYRYNDTTKYIEGQGISFHAPTQSAESYFNFKTIFRYIFSKYKKHIQCVMSYNKGFPKSFYKRIKAYNCARKMLPIVKSKKCWKDMMDIFKWKLSFYIEINTWHKLILKLLKGFGINVSDSNKSDFFA